MELGWNHPISPLALADVIGLDVLPAVVQTIHDEFADSKYRPKLFILLVRAGRLELPRPLGQQILSLPNRIDLSVPIFHLWTPPFRQGKTLGSLLRVVGCCHLSGL